MNKSEYYGKDNPFEAIKIIDYYDLNFCLGNVIKYILRAGKKSDNSYEQDLNKALDYLQHEVKKNAKDTINR